LGLIKRRVWIPWLATGVAAVLAVFLLVFNMIDSPFVNSMRQIPYVGRLGQILQTETGTGRVRVLIWEGVLDMIGWHEPLETPGEDGGADPFNALRPIIGYGPESMYVAYNRFYPPDLAHYEKRNASPDRSHNETFDSLVITGGLGFVVYMFLFTSFFYHGFRWLGLIRGRREKWLFVGLWVGGGIVGAIVTGLALGLPFVGVGIPGGVIGGLALYVFVAVVRATAKPYAPESLESPYFLLMLGLVSAVAAHFAEIHFGIAIAATRTYFWTYAAMMVVIGARLATQPTGAQAADVEVQDGRVPSSGSRGRRRSPGGATVPSLRGEDWQGAVAVLGIISILILSTLLFDYITVQEGNPGRIGTVWRSLTLRDGMTSPTLLVVLVAAAAMVGLVGLSELSGEESSAGKGLNDWLGAVGVFAMMSFAGALLFSLMHAGRLRPVTISSVDAPNPLASTITVYYVFVFAIIAMLALALTFLFRWRPRAGSWSWSLGDVGLLASSVILPVLAAVVIAATNVSLVRADILYKQGLSAENAKQWDGAIYFYEKAIDLAKDQDFYYLFLGRAYMEKGQSTAVDQREQWFELSEASLLKARELEPLNTDHSANLARLHSSWGRLSGGEESAQHLNQALDYYADATSLSPNNARLYNEWGQTYAIMGDGEGAETMYLKSLEIDEAYEQTYLLLGQLYAGRGEMERAEEAYLKAIDLAPRSAEAYLYLGQFYLQRNEWDKAVDAYEQVLQRRPRSVESYGALGYIYSQLGDLEAAVDAYERAVDLQPNGFENQKNLAILYQRVGRNDEAIEAATRALDLAPAGQRASMESFLTQLGAPTAGESSSEVQALLAQGQQEMGAEDWEAAAQTYRQVVALESTNAIAHSALAYIFARQGKLDEAITENLAVLDLVPTDYNSYKNLAILYNQKGQIDKAVSATRDALALAPEEEKVALQTFLDQLQAMQGSSSVEPGQKAGDMRPEQRNQMYDAPPPMIIDTGASYQATIVTEKGNIEVELYADRAPNTVNNFVFLSREGFYDNTTFHRVLPGFMAQAGDPTGTGRGGPGYQFTDEFDPTLRHDAPGILSMANAGPGTNGSQFFITYEATPWLDDRHAVFGRVIEGMDVLESLTPRDPTQNPGFAGDEILTIIIEEEGAGG
jgi:cyclophilin family peptidyl-prolyl cis-trans isomerase/tetratricopeptide (TPR) repeat protein